MPPCMEPRGSVPACSGTEGVRGRAQEEPEDEVRFPNQVAFENLLPRFPMSGRHPGQYIGPDA